MTITAKSIVNEIEIELTRWKRGHSIFNARQIIALSDAFGTLYTHRLISKDSFNKYKDFVFSSKMQIVNDYMYKADEKYKRELKEEFEFYGLME